MISTASIACQLDPDCVQRELRAWRLQGACAGRPVASTPRRLRCGNLARLRRYGLSSRHPHGDGNVPLRAEAGLRRNLAVALQADQPLSVAEDDERNAPLSFPVDCQRLVVRRTEAKVQIGL